MSNKRSKRGYTPTGFKIDHNGVPRDGRGVNALLSSYSSRKKKK